MYIIVCNTFIYVVLIWVRSSSGWFEEHGDGRDIQGDVQHRGQI